MSKDCSFSNGKGTSIEKPHERRGLTIRDERGFKSHHRQYDGRNNNGKSKWGKQNAAPKELCFFNDEPWLSYPLTLLLQVATYFKKLSERRKRSNDPSWTETGYKDSCQDEKPSTSGWILSGVRALHGQELRPPDPQQKNLRRFGLSRQGFWTQTFSAGEYFSSPSTPKVNFTFVLFSWVTVVLIMFMFFMHLLEFHQSHGAWYKS